jgi:nucleoside phosphorylase
MAGVICICGATHLEIHWIRKALIREEEWAQGSALYTQGSYQGKRILLIRTGVGAKNIRRALRLITPDQEIGLAINIGCAGSIMPHMRVAHLNIPVRIGLHMHETDECVPERGLLTFSRTVAMGFKRRKVHFLPSLTVKKAFNREEKRVLHHAAPELGSVDLESYYFARFFSELRIPYLIVRSISDNWDHGIPAVPYLSPSCWKSWRRMPRPSIELPNIVRFHLGVILACWVNQRFIRFFIRKAAIPGRL